LVDSFIVVSFIGDSDNGDGVGVNTVGVTTVGVIFVVATDDDDDDDCRNLACVVNSFSISLLVVSLNEYDSNTLCTVT